MTVASEYHPIDISVEAFIELQTVAFILGAETHSDVSLNDALLVAVRAYRALTHTNSLLEVDSKN